MFVFVFEVSFSSWCDEKNVVETESQVLPKPGHHTFIVSLDYSYLEPILGIITLRDLGRSLTGVELFGSKCNFTWLTVTEFSVLNRIIVKIFLPIPCLNFLS